MRESDDQQKYSPTHLTPNTLTSRQTDIDHRGECHSSDSVPENMELWFVQIEHWFKVVGITGDNRKFSTVVSALDAKLLPQVYNIVRNPPASNRFKAISKAIVHNFAESEQQRIQQLILGIQLGVRKPSHLLIDLRRVACDFQDEKLLNGLWMLRLPVEVQICLETSIQIGRTCRYCNRYI